MQRKVLVSGATGFIAGHVIAQLLALGHQVVGTVRDVSDTAKSAHLHAMPGAENLLLVAADLNGADPFMGYADVDVIQHLASPYVVNVADPQRDLVVKRVVLTSSMAAVTDEPGDGVLTEADWNEKSSLTRNPYYYSKTMAERAAWEFMAREKPGFDLVVINPFLVTGPSHTRAINTSPQIFVDMLKGAYPAVLALTWGLVDVRDVAAAHVAAMNVAGAKGRYLCVSGNLSMAEVMAQMRAEGFTGKLPKLDLSGGFGTGLMKLASYTQPKGTGSYLRSHLGRVPHYDAAKSRRELGLVYQPAAATLSDTLADLVKWGHIAAPGRAA
jgi:dihydroflavonol-4-reductase